MHVGLHSKFPAVRRARQGSHFSTDKQHYQWTTCKGLTNWGGRETHAHGWICSLSWRDGTGQSFVLNSDIKHMWNVLGLTFSVQVWAWAIVTCEQYLKAKLPITALSCSPYSEPHNVHAVSRLRVSRREEVSRVHTTTTKASSTHGEPTYLFLLLHGTGQNVKGTSEFVYVSLFVCCTHLWDITVSMFSFEELKLLRRGMC